MYFKNLYSTIELSVKENDFSPEVRNKSNRYKLSLETGTGLNDIRQSFLALSLYFKNLWKNKRGVKAWTNLRPHMKLSAEV